MKKEEIMQRNDQITCDIFNIASSIRCLEKTTLSCCQSDLDQLRNIHDRLQNLIKK